MQCASCGFANPEGMSFCGKCGAPLHLSCSQCGFANLPATKFCRECGTALTAPAGSHRSTPMSLPAPAQSVPERRSAEAERRQLTVMFCDLVGSTALSTQLDPEEFREVIQAYQQTCGAVVSQFEGYIDLQLLKLQQAVTGSAPPGVNYRFSISFSTEALRQRWVASAEHQQVWGALDAFLTTHDVAFLLFEIR